MKVKTAFAVATMSILASAALADDETTWTDGETVRTIRTWIGATNDALSDTTKWNGSGDILSTDYLLLNNNTTASVSDGQNISATRFYIGWGWRYDPDQGKWCNSASFDHGAYVAMSGGSISVDSLCIGAGYADHHDSVLSMDGTAAVTVGSLVMGDCASYQGEGEDHNKVSKLLLAGNSRFTASGEFKIGNYSGSSNRVEVSGNATLQLNGDGNIGSSGMSVFEMSGGTVENTAHLLKLGNGGTLTATLSGGTLRSAQELHVANGGTTKVTVEGGAIQSTYDDTTSGDYATYRQMMIGVGGSNGNGEVVLKEGGSISVGSLHIGRDGGTGSLVLDGGTLSLNAGSWWGSINVAWGTSSTGTLTVKSGTYSVPEYVCAGRTGNGVFDMQGGTFRTDGWLSAGHESGSYGKIMVSGGTIKANTISVGHETAGAVGEMVVSGGDVYSFNDLYVGRSGQGTLTINGGTVTVASESGNERWMKINQNNTDFAGTSTLNLNGGTLAVSSIAYGDGSNARGVINFNGGTLKTYPKSWTNNMIQESDYLTVRVLPGGAILDTDTYDDMAFAENLDGDDDDSAGGIVKKGSGKLKFNASVGVKGYVYVQGGNLELPAGVTELDKIEVSSGATLTLNGDVTVRSLVNNGTISGGTVTETGKALATAVWSDYVGDRDATNPLNWKVYDEDGKRVAADVLPTSVCAVTIPYSGEMPTNMSAITVASISMGISGTVAPRGSWTVPAVVKDAIAWYDYSDESTIQFDGNDGVAGVLNKIENGSDLDAVIFEDDNADHHLPVYGSESINGRKVMTFENSKGLVSKTAPGLSSTDARTLISLGRRDIPQEGDPQFYSIGFSKDSNDTPGMFRISRWDWGQESRFYDSKFEYEDQGVQKIGGDRTISPGADPTDLAITFMDFDGSDAVRMWLYSESVGQTSTVTEHMTAGGSLAADGTEKLYMGYRRQWFSPTKKGILAEQLVFNKLLTDEEQTAVTDYLKAKWYAVPEVDMSLLPANIAFEGENAVYDLGGGNWVFDGIAGAGTISNANVIVTGDIVITVKDDGTVGPLVIDGTLTLGAGAKLVVKNAKKLPAGSVLDAITATGGVSGEFASVETDPAEVSLRARVGTNIVTIMRRNGFSIVIQ